MTKDDLDEIAKRETHCKPWGEGVTISRAERDQLVALARDGMRACDLHTALKRIAAIEDNMFGGDWDEIEEARNIAVDALAGYLAKEGT